MSGSREGFTTDYLNGIWETVSRKSMLSKMKKKIVEDFHSACTLGDEELFTKALAGLKELCKKKEPQELLFLQQVFDTGLYLACKGGNESIVSLLFNDQDIQPNPNTPTTIKGENSTTTSYPLYAACEKGNCNIVQVLLSKEADPDCEHSKDDADTRLTAHPIHAACRGGYVDILNLLLQYNANLQLAQRNYPRRRSFYPDQCTDTIWELALKEKQIAILDYLFSDSATRPSTQAAFQKNLVNILASSFELTARYILDLNCYNYIPSNQHSPAAAFLIKLKNDIMQPLGYGLFSFFKSETFTIPVLEGQIKTKRTINIAKELLAYLTSLSEGEVLLIQAKGLNKEWRKKFQAGETQNTYSLSTN